jgi:predicted 3-demethylubiquinone-9 3-methyltransferase (glyoxalase superfamily)
MPCLWFNFNAQEAVDFYVSVFLKDKFGMFWQIVPKQLPLMLQDPDVSKAKRATEAMFTMTKLNLARLEAALNGENTGG